MPSDVPTTATPSTPALDADSPFRELVFSDLARYRGAGARGWLRVFALCLTDPGMIASLIIRSQQVLTRRGRHLPARLLRTVGAVLIGGDFNPGPRIGPGLMIPHPQGVCLGFDLTIGADVTFAGGVTCAARYPDVRMAGYTPHQKFATIGDGVTLGAHAVLIGDVVIGRDALIGANSVVTSNVADYAVMFGNPARKVGRRDFAPEEPAKPQPTDA